MKTKALIYGAGGYTAGLVIEAAIKKGLSPVLAGRSQRTAAIAEKYSLESRIFSLKGAESIDENLKDIAVVVNLAGPFAVTQKPLIAACLRQNCHYLDIAGEAPEFQLVASFSDEAEASNVMLMPGAGFGVVPTDAAAWILKQKLPDATHLVIGFATEGGVSKGTLKTVIKDICKPGHQREEGKLIPAKPGSKKLQFEVGEKRFKTVLNPWRGDIFSAGFSTEIPNIQTFSNYPGPLVFMMKNPWLFGRFTRSNFMQWLISKAPAGPKEKERFRGSTYVYAKANNPSGESVEIKLKGEEAYAFTGHSVAAIMDQVLQGKWKAGYQSPAQVYGEAALDFGFMEIMP